VHVGRQGIYDRAGDVVAYELFFRDTVHAVDASRRTAQATSQVIVAAFTEFGLEQLVNFRACFINVTREFLTGELPLPFDSNQAALEIIETVEVDDVLIAGVLDLIQRGFTIALDDFVWGAGQERLLDLATYVKIDMLDTDAAVVAETVRRCREYPHISLVAERLETEEQLQRAFDLGFDLFQGHILGRPHVISAVRLSPSRVSRLQLLASLAAPQVDFDEVVRLIGQDPTLSFRLLHAVHTAASGLMARVSSVHEATVLLGLDKVRSWVTLMLLSDLTEASEEQLTTTMTRARVCQAFAERIGLSAGSAFTVGLLSGVADLIGEPTSTIAERLPLAYDIEAALRTGEGRLGEILNAVRGYEKGLVAPATTLMPPEDVVHAYLAAVSWSNEIFSGAVADRPNGRELPKTSTR
jgi:EAL and modified HD-GYP domain-containing signal transduction protein